MLLKLWTTFLKASTVVKLYYSEQKGFSIGSETFL